MKLIPWLVTAGIVILAALVLTQDPEPDPAVEAERAAQTQHVLDLQRENARLRVYTAELTDTAAAHRQREQDAVAAAARRGARVRFLEDSLVRGGAMVRPASGGPPIPKPDATQADSAALLVSCFERYDERSSEADSLRLALGECDRKAAADSARADTLTVANAQLILDVAQADSLRREEIARTRPCTQNLVIAHPPCWKVTTGVSVVTFVLGLLAH